MRAVRTMVAVAVLVFSAVVLASCGGTGNAAKPRAALSHPPLVFVSFDEFSTTSLVGADGRIDAARYPNFAKLAHDGDWFPYSTAPADETPRAMGALLTGKLPARKVKPTYGEMPHNLFTLLGTRYRIDSSEEVTSLCPHRLCPHVRRQTGRSVRHELGAGRPERFERWVRSIHATSKPTFYFKHVLLPHGPWRYLPTGQQFTSAAREIPGWQHAFGSRWISTQKYQRHLLQLGYVDRLVGSLIARLKAQGLYDKSIVVLTADNGESFGRVDNGHEISRGNFGDIALTPLLIKRSYQSHGAMPTRHVRSDDVVPTLARLTHTKIRYRVSGHSIYGPGARKIPARTVVYQRSGHSYTLSGAGLRRWARRARALKLRLFGAGDGPPGLYGIGPFRRLVGKPVAQFKPAAAGRTRAKLNDARAYRAINRSAAQIPTYVTGRLTGIGSSPPRAVAVVINGQVAGTSPTFRTVSGGTLYFATLVPPAALRAGANRVALYAVGGKFAAPRLRALG